MFSLQISMLKKSSETAGTKQCLTHDHLLLGVIEGKPGFNKTFVSLPLFLDIQMLQSPSW